jgi:hypothetical protein
MSTPTPTPTVGAARLELTGDERRQVASAIGLELLKPAKAVDRGKLDPVGAIIATADVAYAAMLDILATRGMAILPLTPSPLMLEAARKMNRRTFDQGIRPMPEAAEYWAADLVYRAMIAAAKAPHNPAKGGTP